ncbi:hypothetical protein ACFL4W_05820, partial [Planctomycetota bacterium]
EAEFTPTNTAKMLIFHYLYKLSPKHPKLAAMRKLIELAQEARTRLLFFVTPLDWQTGEEHHPGEFRKITAANIALIKAIAAPHGIEVLDLSCSLTTDFFAYRRFPNEHLGQQGRAFVADQLAAWVLSGPDAPKPKDKE